MLTRPDWGWIDIRRRSRLSLKVSTPPVLLPSGKKLTLTICGCTSSPEKTTSIPSRYQLSSSSASGGLLEKVTVLLFFSITASNLARLNVRSAESTALLNCLVVSLKRAGGTISASREINATTTNSSSSVKPFKPESDGAKKRVGNYQLTTSLSSPSPPSCPSAP